MRLKLSCTNHQASLQIEFPSILLPDSISSGSIVDITVSRNYASESATQKSFLALQSDIYSTYGQTSPAAPLLRCRNATQTSVVLEWDPISLATAELRSLSLYRNGSKAGNIPRPLEVTSTKISGLAVDTAYTFHLVLRTSAGHYSSEKLTVRTHKMTDLSGITVTPGVLPAPLKYSLAGAVERIGGKIVETVRIDTTHFVCTEARGREWERAAEMNIPVVRPEWVEGCEREGRIVGVRGYYLNADPRLRQVGQGVNVQPQSRRTDSQTSIRPIPTASQQQEQQRPQTSSTAQTPGSAVSPGTSTNGTGPKLAQTPPPPIPPAKDNPDPTPETAESAETSEDEDDLTPEPARQEYRPPQPRDLVQSPFDSSAPKSPAALGGAHEPGGNHLSRKPSDGGSFSEVQL